MRRLILAAVVAIGASLAVAPSAQAGSGCINKTEYDNADLGWTRSQLEVMIDANPDYFFQFDNAVSTGYNHCGGNPQMMAGFTFRNGTLWKKDWNWREL
jgi:hypothetical protein